MCEGNAGRGLPPAFRGRCDRRACRHDRRIRRVRSGLSRPRAAGLRRQILIVTHNANLVANTDADQVVVAQCGPHRDGRLPEIRYAAGGLENPSIRRRVCEILEGGEAAFKERARCLRVRMPSNGTLGGHG